METPTDPRRGQLPEAGDVIDDRYVVEGVLGSGGFAKVFRGLDRRLGRAVAIKLLDPVAPPEDDDGWRVMTERFKREARATAQLQHPSLVEIYDLGFLPRTGHHYIVMELLRGRDLADELRAEGALEPARVLRLFDRALAALGKCHRHVPALVHRDLKPSNLFLVERGTADEDIRILDFGIARMDTPGTTLTRTHHIVGTPGYLAPEYIRTQQVSPALDVYQMGLILAECLTGQRIVDADSSMGCVAQHLERSFELPTPLLDSPLGPILIRSLAADPAHRYPDAQAMREALARLDPASLPRLALPCPMTTLSELDTAATSELQMLPARTTVVDVRGASEAPGNPATRLPAWRRWVLVAALCLAAAGIVAVVVDAWRADPPRITASTVAARPDASADARPAAFADAAAEPVAAAGPPRDAVAAQAPEPPALVSVRVEVTPEDAVIRWGGDRTERGVAQIALSPEQTSEVTVERDGYRTTTLGVSPEDAPLVRVALEPVPQVKGRRQRPAPGRVERVAKPPREPNRPKKVGKSWLAD